MVVTIKTQPGATRQWLRHTLHCFLLVLVASTVMQSRYDMDLAAWGLGVQDYGQPHGWGIPPLLSASGHAHAWVGEEIASAFEFVAFSSVVHVILMYPLVN